MRFAAAIITATGAVLITLIAGMGLAQPADRAGAASDAPPQPAILVADNVELTSDGKLVATGHVEAWYQGKRLQAQKITYDRGEERLYITGPLTLHEPNGTLVLANAGELDRDFHNGLLRGARIVFTNQLQLASQEMSRTDARFSQLYKATVTSCRVCENGRPPLWQIRARRVIHDQEAQKFFFEGAQLLVLDTPVLYWPQLRLPDPTLKRATGFLTPSLHNSTLLGSGARVPFFIAIGNHKDLTLTPFLTTKSTTLEFRYRQLFRKGRLEFEGAISNDDIGTRTNRAYVFAKGAFDLPDDFKLTFDIEAVNDDTYLLDYRFSDKDRLDSQIAIERARRDEYIRGALTQFHSLRVGESNSTLPSIVGSSEYERRFHPQSLGGELRFAAAAHTLFRSSDLRTDGPDPDVFADGRDVTRLTGSADWYRNWVLPAGVLAQVQTGIAVDSFYVEQSGGIGQSQATEFTPSASVQLRWPLLKSASLGATHVIEPTVQVSWVGGSNPFVPNEESTRVEFDEGNLFAISRFTAPDRRERGYNAAIGLKWTRFGPKGWQTQLAVGQVIRDEVPAEVSGATSFTNSSGLQDKFSDVLIGGQLKTNNGLTLTLRSLFDDGFDTTKAEARASWRNELANIGATYIWLQNDPAELRPTTISEYAFDASYRLTRHWTGSADWRYDVASDRSVRAGLGLKYTNECVDIQLSASRRFTSSTILEPSTDISFTVGLRGFTTRTRDKSYAKTCNN